MAGESGRAVAYLLEGKRAALVGLIRRMEMGLPNVDNWRRRVDDLGRLVQSGAQARIRLAVSSVDGLAQRMRALDPAATLGRGFSVVRNISSGQVVSGVGQVTSGDSLSITVADGDIQATAGGNADEPPQTRGQEEEQAARKPAANGAPAVSNPLPSTGKCLTMPHVVPLPIIRPLKSGGRKLVKHRIRGRSSRRPEGS